MRSVSPGRVEGSVLAPASKSVLQRAVVIGALTKGTTTITAGSICDDAAAALRMAEALGADIRMIRGGIEISGGGRPTGDQLDCGESGLSLRMFSAVAALFDTELELVARGNLNRRPVEMVEGPLAALNVYCRTNAGFPPVRIRGPMVGTEIEVDGRTSSQFLTGLLIALPLCEQDSLIISPGLKSKPYVRLTIDLLRRFGVTIHPDDNLERFRVPGRQAPQPTAIEVEGDWSGASFPLVAGAIAGDVEVRGLDPSSCQADRRILDALSAAGIRHTLSSASVRVQKRSLHSFEFDATDCPDLFPPLVVLAANCSGISRIRGASRLISKECDRKGALIEEFGKLGCRLSCPGDVMQVTGGALEGGTVRSHGDHRIAMAAATAALTATGAVKIESGECVSKSYPGFFSDLESLGVKLS